MQAGSSDLKIFSLLGAAGSAELTDLQYTDISPSWPGWALRLAGPFETTTASVSRYVVTERLEPGPSALLIIISQHLLSLLSSGLPIQTNTITTASHNKIKKKAWLADGWTGLVAGTGMMQVRSYKQSEIPIWTEWSIN